MIAGLALLLAATPVPAPVADEIVVQAVRGKCRISLADRTLSERDLRARAASWRAGRPLKVVEPRGADRKCLARITFKLSDMGVKLIQFVDAPAPE